MIRQFVQNIFKQVVYKPCFDAQYEARARLACHPRYDILLGSHLFDSAIDQKNEMTTGYQIDADFELALFAHRSSQEFVAVLADRVSSVL